MKLVHALLQVANHLLQLLLLRLHLLELHSVLPLVLQLLLQGDGPLGELELLLLDLLVQDLDLLHLHLDLVLQLLVLLRRQVLVLLVDQLQLLDALEQGLVVLAGLKHPVALPVDLLP